MFKILFSTLPEFFVVSVMWLHGSVSVAVFVTIACAILSYNVYKTITK